MWERNNVLSLKLDHQVRSPPATLIECCRKFFHRYPPFAHVLARLCMLFLLSPASKFLCRLWRSSGANISLEFTCCPLWWWRWVSYFLIHPMYHHQNVYGHISLVDWGPHGQKRIEGYSRCDKKTGPMDTGKWWFVKIKATFNTHAHSILQLYSTL